MLFKNEKLKSMLDMGGKKNGINEIRNCAELAQIIEETINAICDSDITQNEELFNYGIKVDLDKLKEKIAVKSKVFISNQIRRKGGLRERLKDIFGISIENIEKKYYFEYYKILYLFYMLENVLFPGEKITAIYKQPALDSIDSTNTVNGLYTHIIKKELKCECSSDYIEDAEKIISEAEYHWKEMDVEFLKKFVSTKSRQMKESVSKLSEEIGNKMEKPGKFDDYYIKGNPIEWLYFQIIFFEKRSYMKGMILSFEYDLKPREIQKKYLISFEDYNAPIPLCEVENLIVQDEMLPFYYQKELDAITEYEKIRIKRCIPMFATYYNILKKHLDMTSSARVIEYDGKLCNFLLLGEIVGLMQEILCAKEDNPITTYIFPRYHNTKNLSVMRALEKGHGNPLYIIQELVLLRKYWRALFLNSEEWGNEVYEFANLYRHCFYKLYFEIFNQLDINGLKAEMQHYDMILQGILQN